MTLNRVIVDLGAIRDNYKRISDWAGTRARVMAVVKSDAYGHGSVPVAQTLVSAGCKFLAVFELAEAEVLRRAGIGIPILIMGGLSSEETARACQVPDLAVTLFREDQARDLSKAACEAEKTLPVHIKLDTGMGRLGIPPDELAGFIQQLRSLPGLVLNGVYSHFATAEEPGHTYTVQQHEIFERALAQNGLKEIGLETHIANSAAILDGIGSDFNWVRSGISIYGSSPGGDRGETQNLRPAMTVRSELIQLKQLPPGSGISYGLTYTTDEPIKVAVIPMGYGHGLDRRFSNRGAVLVRGRRAPVIGRVCMNLTMLDVTGVPDAAVGDEVIVLGAQNGAAITAESLAGALDTISYEVFCMFGHRLPRTYINTSAEDHAQERAKDPGSR